MRASMFVPVLYSKVHRATVTEADLDYEGSLTLDRTLMDYAGLIPFQQIAVYNIADGARFETYVIEGTPDSGTVQVNGAAAHLAKKGDLVIIAAYVSLPANEAAQWRPRLVYVDARNRPLNAGAQDGRELPLTGMDIGIGTGRSGFGEA